MNDLIGMLNLLARLERAIESLERENAQLKTAIEQLQQELKTSQKE